MIDRPLLAKRLREAYEYLESQNVVGTISEFAKAIGKSQGDVSSAMAAYGRVMTENFLMRVADAFPEYINREYLKTGEGGIANVWRTMRPFYDAKASAGFMDSVSESKSPSEYRPIVPGVRDYDFSIEVSGDSMMPRIEEGDILLCHILNDRLNPPIGKICVLDTVDGVFVKQITEANDESVTLHSLNPAYSDKVMPSGAILNIAEVVGLVRSFV